MEISITVDGKAFTYEKIVGILHGYIKHAEAVKRYQKSKKGLVATRRAAKKYNKKVRERKKAMT